MKNLVRFEELELGASFRLPTAVGYVGGIFYNTGPASYGLEPGSAIWPWYGEDPGACVEKVDAQREAA